jgi:hypothetical protein
MQMLYRQTRLPKHLTRLRLLHAVFPDLNVLKQVHPRAKLFHLQVKVLPVLKVVQHVHNMGVSAMPLLQMI